MNRRPELLVSPTLPPPLYDLTPKRVLGDKWWKEVRKAADEMSEGCCHVCGINKRDTRKKNLEGHEIYNIDHDTFTVELKEVVVLCRRCHNFIHFGRLIRQFLQGDVLRNYLQIVARHGVNLLAEVGIKPPATQGIHYLILEKGFSQYEAQEYAIAQELHREKFNPVDWNLWTIKIGNKEYKSSSIKEWLNAEEIQE